MTEDNRTLEEKQQAEEDARKIAADLAEIEANKTDEQKAIDAENAAIADAENPEYNGKPIQSFGETVGAKSFPEAVEVAFSSIVGKPIIVLDFAEEEFHHGDVAILLFELPRVHGQFSTISGGEVVLRKLKKAKAANLLPLMGTIDYPQGQRYYDII